MKKILVYIEKSQDGDYWGTTQNMPGVVSSFGNTLEELENNLKEAIQDNIELATDLKEDWVGEYKNFTLEYELDLSAFFNLIPEIKISVLAKKAGINQSLLRQYKTGAANASIEQLKKIEVAVHKLGEELLSISF